MKKVLFVAVVAALATLTSCKKDYTCSCTNAPAGAMSEVKWEKVKKDDAQTSCDALETTYKASSADVNCELK